MSNATPAKTNVLALVGMILSLLGLVLGLAVGWWVSGAFGALCIAGVICSHIAVKQIKTRSEGGRPLAITGIITGYAGLLFAVIQIVIAIVVIIFFASAASVLQGLTTTTG